MQHIQDIAALVRALEVSSRFHTLVIQSPPGWAKSTTIDRILGELGIPYRGIGAYTTPLSLYNELSKTPDITVVLDDCAGVFGDATALSILKAASWPGMGASGNRQISWLSTSDRVACPSFTFRGKLILLTNSIPSGHETDAFLSRALVLKLRFGTSEISEMLRQAAESEEHFENRDLARTVANGLVELNAGHDGVEVNLRSLQIAYDLAQTNPDNWMELLKRIYPMQNPQQIVTDLQSSEVPVETQAREFMRKTGLSRRNLLLLQE